MEIFIGLLGFGAFVIVVGLALFKKMSPQANFILIFSIVVLILIGLEFMRIYRLI